MHIIALIAQKGGVGKTTIAIHLATAFAAEGRATLILDLDPQSSATEWKDHRTAEFPAVLSIQPSRLGKVMEEARSIGTEILILDTAPHSESTSLEAARAADLVLVPCQPTIMDLRAMTKTVELLNLVKKPAYAILNSVPHQGTVTDEAAQMITDTFGLSMAPVRFGDRVAYSRCMIEGQAAQEFEPGGKAAREVAQACEWVSALLHLQDSKRAEKGAAA
jgi:chromosome partitioning protein